MNFFLIIISVCFFQSGEFGELDGVEAIWDTRLRFNLLHRAGILEIATLWKICTKDMFMIKTFSLSYCTNTHLNKAQNHQLKQQLYIIFNGFSKHAKHLSK